MHGAMPTQGKLLQLPQVAQVVGLLEETRLPVIAPLHDVLRNTR
jgi:hypothetical protein